MFWESPYWILQTQHVVGNWWRQSQQHQLLDLNHQMLCNLATWPHLHLSSVQNTLLFEKKRELQQGLGGIQMMNVTLYSVFANRTPNSTHSSTLISTWSFLSGRWDSSSSPLLHNCNELLLNSRFSRSLVEGVCDVMLTADDYMLLSGCYILSAVGSMFYCDGGVLLVQALSKVLIDSEWPQPQWLQLSAFPLLVGGVLEEGFSVLHQHLLLVSASFSALCRKAIWWISWYYLIVN